MKKVIPILLLLTAVSCGKQPIQEKTFPEDTRLTHNEITTLTAMKERHTIGYKDAEIVALEAPALFSDGTKSENKVILEGIAITKDMAGLTKSDVYIADTMMYLFNYADNSGYIFVSADERAPGILAYIEDGNFNPADSIECPGTSMLFSGIETMQRLEIEKVERLKDSIGETALEKYNFLLKRDDPDVNTKAPSIVSVHWKIAYERNSTLGYSRTVMTNWSQGYPFNEYLPLIPNGDHAYVGCVATATAQLIAHHDFPKYYDTAPLYTSELRKIKNSSDFITEQQLHKIAYFNKIIFDNIITSYDNNGSGATYEDARNFLRSIGYIAPDATSDYNFENVKKSISSHCPVYIDGFSHRTNKFLGWIYSYSGGHAWIIDAYSNINIYNVEVTTYSDNTVKREKTFRELKMFNHCNMGHGPGKNGYYPEGVFNERYGPFTKSTDIDAVYRYQIKIATGIKPS